MANTQIFDIIINKLGQIRKMFFINQGTLSRSDFPVYQILKSEFYLFSLTNLRYSIF